MKSRRPLLPATLLLLGAVAWLSACGADRVTSATSGQVPPPTGTGTSQIPHFLTAASTAPAIANPVVKFWAKSGVDQSVSMLYHARPGHTDSTAFLFFRVRAKSLVTRADGTPLAPGDSVLITLTLVDSVKLAVDFQPAGLRFAASDPANLKLEFLETDEDRSPGLIPMFKIWRRETLLDPWTPLTSLVLTDTNEVEADIAGFTGYAIAY